MNTEQRWLRGGLFLTTLATLLLELLDVRLLSVLTWYHLSFLAVSLAMLGMMEAGTGGPFRFDISLRMRFSRGAMRGIP